MFDLGIKAKEWKTMHDMIFLYHIHDDITNYFFHFLILDSQLKIN